MTSFQIFILLMLIAFGFFLFVWTYIRFQRIKRKRYEGWFRYAFWGTLLIFLIFMIIAIVVGTHR